VRRLDRGAGYPQELTNAWVELGLLRIPFDEKCGGLGGDVIDLLSSPRGNIAQSADFFMAYAGSVFCGLNLARKGSEEQKRSLLPKLFSGESRCPISMSEPEAGRTSARCAPAPGAKATTYFISGQKLWARRGREGQPSSMST